MNKIAIISGSDQKYLPFLKNLISSLKNTGALEIADLCILDVENDSNYLENLEKFIHIKKKNKI